MYVYQPDAGQWFHLKRKNLIIVRRQGCTCSKTLHFLIGLVNKNFFWCNTIFVQQPKLAK